MASRTRSARTTRVVVLALLTLAFIAGCTNKAEPKEDPRELLAAAKRKLDAAPSARFVLTTASLPTDSASLVGAKGVLARPGKFKGDLDIKFGDNIATVSVISIGGSVYAKLPFATTYTKTDPARFGLADPADLMDPDKGVSTLLVKSTEAKLSGKTRIGKEVVQEVTAKVPGRLIADLLVSAEPAKPVAATFGLTEATGEVRRVTLKGPFFKAGVDSTLTLVLDRYGAPVTITAPPGVASPQ